MQKIAVLIHGCNLDAPFWKEMVWGTWENKGRILCGIEEATRRNAELIIWGSGLATHAGSDVKESHFTFEFALERIELLAKLFATSEEQLRTYLDTTSAFDETSHNTKTEVRNALALCQERHIEELYLVSSSTHIARCLLNAVVLKKEMKLDTLRVYAAPSDSFSEEWRAEDVVVIEPQHRADRPHVPFHILAQRLVTYQNDPEKAPVLFKELSETLDRFDSESL